MKKLIGFGRAIGFTRNETAVIIFLSAAAAAGGLIRFLSPPASRRDYAEAYRIHDSVFAARAAAAAVREDALRRPENETARRPAPKERPLEASPARPADLNRAGPRQLEAIPGIGPSIAGRILEYRERNGPFTSVDELRKVSGIGPKTYERIKPYLRVGE